MAKATTAVAAEQPESAGCEPLTLTEFCRRLSERVRSPELIGAFYHGELAAERLRDTEAEYKARFDAFTKKPV